MPAEKFYNSAVDVEGDGTPPFLTVEWGRIESATPGFDVMSSERGSVDPLVTLNGRTLDRSGLNRLIRALKKARDQVYGSDE